MNGSGIFWATLMMFLLGIFLFGLAVTRGGVGMGGEALKIGLKQILPIIPLLVCAFLIVGLVNVLFPKEVLSVWIGKAAGLRGIWLGTIFGAVTPGGPFITYPLVAALFGAGASIGTMVAFVTSWSLIAVARLPMEIAIVGPKITFIRLACTFFFAPVSGMLAEFIFGKFF